MEFSNVYDDARRAEAYDKLEFPGTYYLAYRDLPLIIGEGGSGTDALDFGCGTGRSTRFLQRLGFRTIGVDISEEMIRRARERDPQGDYRLVSGEQLNIADSSLDVVLAAFTFDNIPTRDKKVQLLRELARVTRPAGKIVILVSSPEIYTHEWASFTTRDFPENRSAKCGDRVRIVMTDVEDRRPVEDVVWPDEDYRSVFAAAGLEVVATHKPLARPDEPFDWISETTVAPWVIYELRMAF